MIIFWFVFVSLLHICVALSRQLKALCIFHIKKICMRQKFWKEFQNTLWGFVCFNFCFKSKRKNCFKFKLANKLHHSPLYRMIKTAEESEERTVLEKKARFKIFPCTWTSVTSHVFASAYFSYNRAECQNGTREAYSWRQDKHSSYFSLQRREWTEGRVGEDRKERRKYLIMSFGLLPSFPLKSISHTILSYFFFENLHLILYLIIPSAIWIMKDVTDLWIRC